MPYIVIDNFINQYVSDETVVCRYSQSEVFWESQEPPQGKERLDVEYTDKLDFAKEFKTIKEAKKFIGVLNEYLISCDFEIIDKNDISSLMS